MASNQEALRRYRIIHNILKRGGKYKSSYILRACKDAYITASLRTIQKDLEDLAEDQKLGFFLPIVKDKATKTYYYSEIPNNIFPALELETNEVNALLFYSKTINQYNEYPLFQEISTAIRKVVENSNIPKETKELFEKQALMESEKHLPVKGVELIIDLLEAISNKRIIKIEYRKFHDSQTKEYLIKPIFLKEDKQLWYIIGKKVENDRMTTLALDRIVNLMVSEEYFETFPFCSDEYFKYSFGVTVTDQEPIDVIISFDPSQSNYLETLPIHKTQTVIEKSKNRFVLSVKVKPSYEFYSKIYSYGDKATVLSPIDIREEFLKTFEQAVKNYK